MTGLKKDFFKALLALYFVLNSTVSLAQTQEIKSNFQPLSPSSIQLPNPQVNYDFSQYEAFVNAKDVESIRNMYLDYYKKYYTAYEKEYLQTSQLREHQTPLKSVYDLTINRLKISTFDNLKNNKVNPPLIFKNGLDEALLRFETSQLAGAYRKLNELEGRIAESSAAVRGNQFAEVGTPSEVTALKKQVGALYSMLSNLKFFIYLLAIGLLAVVGLIFYLTKRT